MSWVARMTLSLFAVAVPLYIYTGLKGVEAVTRLWPQMKMTAQWTVAAAGVWLSLYPLLLFFGYANLRAFRDGGLWTDRLLVYPFWIGAILVLQIVPYLLALDVVKWSIRLAVDAHWTEMEAWGVMAVLTVTTAYVGGRIYWDTCRVQVREQELAVEGLPEALDGLRIVHVTDVQADFRTDRKRLTAYVETVNGLQADLVLFSGDLVTRGTAYIGQGAEMVGQMQGRHGVFACLGDHDIWSDQAQIIRQLETQGVQTLDNRHLELRVDGQAVGLSVLTNAYSDRPNLYAFAQEIPEAPLLVLLTHQPSPRVVDFAEAKGYHLMVSGHTHGGQVVANWFGWQATLARSETPYVSGCFQVDALLLSVNNGLGLTLAPVRYRAPAEVTLIRVRSR